MSRVREEPQTDLLKPTNPSSLERKGRKAKSEKRRRDNLNHAIMILLNWRYVILTHMSVTVVAPTCQ
jgi:hypothetical protein